MLSLSEEYLNKCNPNLIERIRIWWNLDVYYATNLSEIMEEFETKSPRRYDPSWGGHSALVLMYNLNIKEIKQEEFIHGAFSSSRYLPYFQITDGITSKVATWAAGNEKYYLSDKEKYNFNEDKLTPIPKILLQYVDYKNSRMYKGSHTLIIKRLDDFNQPEPEKNLEMELKLAFSFS